MKIIIYLLSFLFIVPHANAEKKKRMPAATPYFGQCTLDVFEGNTWSTLIDAKDIMVTSGAGGSRQNCSYSSSRTKIKLLPVTLDSNGFTISFKYEEKIILTTTSGASGAKRMTHGGFFTAPDGKDYSYKCMIGFQNEGDLPDVWRCPIGSDNPTP